MTSIVWRAPEAPPSGYNPLSQHLIAAAGAIGVENESHIVVVKMPTTRSSTGARPTYESPPSKSNKAAAPKRDKKAPSKSTTSKKRAAPTEDKEIPSVPKKAKSEAPGDDKKKLAEKLISAHGELYLSQLGVANPTASDPKTLFTVLLTSLLFSARISHHIAIATAKLLLKEGWDDVKKLKESTWERRTEVLTEGGYTHYREKTATMLGDLSQLVMEKYDGDLNNLKNAANESPSTIRKLLKEIKGVGNVGVDIFFQQAQAIWPFLAPFLDTRSKDAAKRLGVGEDAESVYEAVGRNNVQMGQLVVALITVKLEGKWADFGV